MNSLMESPPGPPSHANSQRQRIFERLREAGSRGVLASEFYDDPLSRFGRSARNRVNERRAMGHKIDGELESKIDFRYKLIEATQALTVFPDYSAQKNNCWYERQTGRSMPGPSPASLGPLFDGQGAGS